MTERERDALRQQIWDRYERIREVSPWAASVYARALAGEISAAEALRLVREKAAR